MGARTEAEKNKAKADRERLRNKYYTLILV
jgi:hypothetical protein